MDDVVSQLTERVVELERQLAAAERKLNRPRDPALCRSKAEQLIDPLRKTARRYGYALGVHGSLERDIDLIAVPWVDDAVDPTWLACTLLQCAIEVNGVAWIDHIERGDPYNLSGCPGGHAHGRLCWSFHLGGGPYIDLSVVPPRTFDDGAPR